RDLDDVRRSLANAGPNGRFETAYRVMHRDRGILWSFVVGQVDEGGHRGVVVQSDQFQRLETELEHKSRMLEAVSRSLPGALYQIRMSPEGVMTCPFCAPSIEALLGTSAESIMESPDVLSTYVVEEDRSLLFETAMASARDLSPWELSFRVQRPDGEVKQLWSGGVPEREPDGSTIWTSLCVDITEVARRSHEADARTRAFYERDKLESLGRLAGGMAHDINNLLVGVLGNAELLRETTLPRHVVELAEEIALAAAGCAQLTRQILAFAGRGRVRDDAVELRQLVEETVRLARPMGEGPAPQLALGPHALVVRGDPTELRQVVLNLVTNAMQASPEAPVEVRSRVVDRADAHPSLEGTGHFVQISIEDRGDGILPAHRARVFEPYFTTRRDGRGLGLASALGIVRNHGGVLAFDSTPGMGTTFDIWLPLDPEGAEGSSVSLLSPAAPPRNDLAGLQILVVDDQPEVLAMTRRMLQNRGAMTEGLTDPREVLGQLAEGAYHLLVIDLTMPELPGRELFEQVREVHPELPVVLYSGYSAGALSDLHQLHRATYLEKPFTIEQLLQAVRRVYPG
ncbi:MAG: ATP-binding protein, partial [Myxococcota bacterium]